MNFIRKYYNTEVAETGGGNETAVAETPITNIAAAMAKHGVNAGSENQVAKPIGITKPKEAETKVEEPTPAATATVDKPTETKAPETSQEKPKEEVKKVEETPIAKSEPQKTTTTWQEVLKTQQPDTILKELGFDEQKANFVSKLKEADPKMIGLLQAYEDGKLGEYVNELATDYSKMTAEEVMRHQLRVEYPKASAKALDALFEEEVMEKYKLDPDKYTEAEVERGQLLLAAKADKYRDSLLANQEKFLLPKPPESKAAPVVDNTAQEQQKKDNEQYVNRIKDDPYTKEIYANKKITLGEGDEKFSFPVDPNSLVGVLTDPAKYAETLFETVTGEDGQETVKYSTEKQLLSAAIQVYGKPFLDEYAKHYKSLGGKKIVDTLDNAKPADGTQASKSDTTPNSPAAAMAKSGKMNYAGV